MWTVADRRFLHRLQIASDEPPPPLPRFQVEPAKDGDYQVVDFLFRRKVSVPWVFAAHPLARACAELKAQELNEEYERGVK